MKLPERLVPKGTYKNIIALKRGINQTRNNTYKYIFVPGTKGRRIEANYSNKKIKQNITHHENHNDQSHYHEQKN